MANWIGGISWYNGREICHGLEVYDGKTEWT